MCDALPACLPRLSQLQALHLWSTPWTELQEEGTSAAQLEAALREMGQLTQLFLHDLDYCTALPAALAGLDELERFSWSGWKLRQPQLPAGPWLAGLRSVVLPVECLAASLESLPRLRRLEELQLLCGFSNVRHPPPWQPSADELAVVRWAGRHPRLRRLTPSVFFTPEEPPEMAAALDEARRANPALCVDRNVGLLFSAVMPSLYAQD